MAQEKARIVFMGTPDFAAGILRRMLAEPDFEISGVYTQPDKPAGRGNRLQPSPVKKLALEAGLPLFQPATLKKAEEQEALAALAPDFLVVAAYGMLLPQAVLDIPAFAPVNVHTSLLPAYRGAAPVQRAVMDGCRETGVSIMRMEAGLDTGPWYAQASLEIGRDSAGELFSRLEELSAPLLFRCLRDIRDGRAVEHVQEGESTYAKKILKEEALLDFSLPVLAADAAIRGLTPDPGARTLLDLGERGSVALVVEKAKPMGEDAPQGAPGTVFARKGRLCVRCLDGALELERIRPSGKKSMDVPSFLNGQRIKGGVFEAVGLARKPEK